MHVLAACSSQFRFSSCQASACAASHAQLHEGSMPKHVLHCMLNHMQAPCKRGAAVHESWAGLCDLMARAHSGSCMFSRHSCTTWWRRLRSALRHRLRHSPADVTNFTACMVKPNEPTASTAYTASKRKRLRAAHQSPYSHSSLVCTQPPLPGFSIVV